MQSYVIFTCALTLLLATLHVLAQENNDDPDTEDSANATVINLVQLQMSTSRDKHQLRDVTQDLATLHNKNLLLESRNKNLFEQLSAVTSQQNTLVAQLTSQLQEAQNDCKSQQRSMTEQLDRQAVEMKLMKSQLEADIRKEIMRESLESGKLIEKLTRENENLKLKEQDCQSYKGEFINELRTEVGDLSHNMSLQVQSDQRQLTADIRAELGAVKSLINMSLQSDNLVLSGQRQLSSNITTKVWEQCRENSQKNEDMSKEKIKSLINTVASLRLENENLKKSDEHLKAVVSKHVQEKSAMTSQISQLQSKMSSCDTIKDLKTLQSEHKDMLTQVLTKLEQHDAQLKSHKNHSCQLHVDLPTTKLNNKTYYFSYKQPSMTWYKADNFCRSHGMHLVSVESQEEWELLKPEIKKLAHKINWPWSSGSNAAEEGNWKWTALGSDVIFFAGRGIDNAASQNCMLLYKDYWGDDSCTVERSFICEVNSAC